MPKIYSYVIVHDSGFAPNPYGGVCTLATCKPVIRRTAKIGDWLVGTGSTTKGFSGKVIYAAQIDTVLAMAEYGASQAFEMKQPVPSGTIEQRCGDNIYFQDCNGTWFQRENEHHCPRHMNHDLAGKNVLISVRFWYFGSAPQPLPERLAGIVKLGPGHKITDSKDSVVALERWLSGFTPGQASAPGLNGVCGGC
ncbi:hypothetical protein [Pseudomonas sp. UBA6323]|uniref:Nmad2 family putative nucleotide modification protein n=1 Tax=Pseudomonas sp. UBA6323 TaxID=1947329 RepID=UPI0025DCDD63|nr:hypothetical protein [Pseudomonas sp. UBA6323]